MHNFKIYIVKFTRFNIQLFICLFIIFLIVFSSNNFIAAKNGLLLWANSIIPSLFPFFVANELLHYTNIINIMGRLFHKIMRPVFNVPGEGSFALIMGLISGYPIGAKTICSLKEKGICNDIECERLLSFTNNSSPLFILGTIGLSMFSNIKIGIILLSTHILSCLLTGFLFRFWKRNKPTVSKTYKSFDSNTKCISFSNLGEILETAIISSIKTILVIGGFVVFFSVILSILKTTNLFSMISYTLSPISSILGISEFVTPFLYGIIELTNGLSQLCVFNTNSCIVLCSAILGFGGFSVLFQIYSIIYKYKISIKPYLIGKIMQSIFASIFTYIFLF